MTSRDASGTASEITPEVLLRAYACGIFPMAESADDPSLFWVEPEMRGVIPLGGFRIASRLARTVRSDAFTVTVDRAFKAVIAGCGNIYADEACFLARVRPSRRAFRLTAKERGRLLAALPIVMREAIRRRGSSFSDYRDGFGAKGEAFEALLVYGRGGGACVRCGSTLRQSTVAGRTTVFCARCQV